MSHVLNFYSVNNKVCQEIRTRVPQLRAFNPMENIEEYNQTYSNHAVMTQQHLCELPEKKTPLLLQMVMFLTTSVTRGSFTRHQQSQNKPRVLDCHTCSSRTLWQMSCKPPENHILISSFPATASAQRADPGMLHHWHQPPVSPSPSLALLPELLLPAPSAALPALCTGHPHIFLGHTLLQTHLQRLLLPKVQ